jgi:phosphoribosylaminoimidazolecarboxamide formyltransferase/IMP cyclohydrolase
MTAEKAKPVRRALLSVSDKRGLEQLAPALKRLNIEVISTGGTARACRELGVQVLDVSEVTGMPEMMDGRVKTLHPKIHGGLLARSGIDDEALQRHGINSIDLLVVNLYPFRETLAKPGVSFAECIEEIDIGGPAMLRAAAKNHAEVAVICDPDDYPALIEALDLRGGTSERERRFFAGKVFAHTASYDGAISEFLGARRDSQVEMFPPTLHLNFVRGDVLRYGENPHQAGALYLEQPVPAGTVAAARVLQGKSLSFNNLADADAAFECVKQFDEPACVIVKHMNPCGVALAAQLDKAYDLAYQTDPISAFGGIIAFNRVLDGDTARTMVARQFIEVVIAPGFSEMALAALASKPNVRVLAVGEWSNQSPSRDFKRIQGGLLVQDGDTDAIKPSDLKVVSQRAPSGQEFKDLLFAWKVAMFVKSNAIVYANKSRTIGIGAGQMSRVVSARIAAMKAEEARLEVAGSVLASDAFFPFRDGIDAAAAVGIKAVIQPGGSMRDEEVIKAADDHGIAMVFTGRRHFRH